MGPGHHQGSPLPPVCWYLGELGTFPFPIFPRLASAGVTRADEAAHVESLIWPVLQLRWPWLVK